MLRLIDSRSWKNSFLSEILNKAVTAVCKRANIWADNTYITYTLTGSPDSAVVKTRPRTRWDGGSTPAHDSKFYQPFSIIGYIAIK